MKRERGVRIFAQWSWIVSQLKSENFSRLSSTDFLPPHWTVGTFRGASTFSDSRVRLVKEFECRVRFSDWLAWPLKMRIREWILQTQPRRSAWMWSCKLLCVMIWACQQNIFVSFGTEKHKYKECNVTLIKTSRPVPRWQMWPNASELNCSVLWQKQVKSSGNLLAV